MPFLILDIETVPRPSIDSEVEIEITKKINARVEKIANYLIKKFSFKKIILKTRWIIFLRKCNFFMNNLRNEQYKKIFHQ